MQEEPKGFKKARKEAEEALKDEDRIGRVLKKAAQIISRSPGNLQGYITEIKTLIRMMRAYLNGSYKDIATTNLILILAALVYLINPLDVVPDFLIGIGFLDDATVIGFVLMKVRSEIQSFKEWELNP